ncbi:hypothetical protein [Anaeromicropila populeti]|uniref:Uncharacterized protein n=1 Tax=Anaeromicropila populeti TaxID=37658 RepID=A0A1I6JXV1_9FIRM|nr:hypothetical protein [Anaeromicropila populeti]SFR83797.1 hypothetical protein SAMN05661086_02062 [Anaeromicropila populeti]
MNSAQNKQNTQKPLPPSTSKDSIHNGPKNSIPDHFIPSGINPNNNAYFAERNNPLSSKGDSASSDDSDNFNS